MNCLEAKYIIIMVGLPARGKSFLSKKLNSLFTFLGIGSEIFNLGSYRRKSSAVLFDSYYFAPDNLQAKSEREQFARLALEDALEFLRTPYNHVAIYDGTNLSRDRREFLRSVLAEKRVKTIWIQMECSNKDIISQNVIKSKLDLQDYSFIQDKSLVYSDFMRRIEEYQKSALPILQQEMDDNPLESFIFIREMGLEIEFNISQDTNLEYLKLDSYLLKTYSGKVKVKVKLIHNSQNEADSIKTKSKHDSQTEISDEESIRIIELENEDLETESKRRVFLDRLVEAPSRKTEIVYQTENLYAYQLMSLFEF